jgi:hypothetical protein
MQTPVILNRASIDVKLLRFCVPVNLLSPQIVFLQFDNHGGNGCLHLPGLPHALRFCKGGISFGLKPLRNSDASRQPARLAKTNTISLMGVIPNCFSSEESAVGTGKADSSDLEVPGMTSRFKLAIYQIRSSS